MTRIIGGTAGGRRLQTPKGDLTRPTSDRVKEALFSAVEASLGSLQGLRFLDLYAGSGAVGLEALSRGAATATLVEQDRRTAGLIRANARTVGLPAAEVVTGSVTRSVQRSVYGSHPVVCSARVMPTPSAPPASSGSTDRYTDGHQRGSDLPSPRMSTTSASLAGAHGVVAPDSLIGPSSPTRWGGRRMAR